MTQRNENCIFCGIASGQVPAHTVYKNDRIVAFLDINPIRPGHTQIIPKEHYPYFDDLPAALLAEIAETGQLIAHALKEIFSVERVGFAFTGSDVPHAHAHVVPMVAPDDLTSRQYIAESTVTYRNPPRPPREEFSRVATQIRSRMGFDNLD